MRQRHYRNINDISRYRFYVFSCYCSKDMADIAISGKNGIHCKAIADNLTKRFHEYSRMGLLSALFFLHTAYFGRLPWQP